MSLELMELQSRVARLERQMELRPITIKAAPAQFMAIVIDGGNTLTSGQNGIKYTSSVSSVPSAYDATVTSTFIDGIGRGTLYIDNVSQGYVLVVNDSRSLLNGIALLNMDTIGVTGSVSIPVSGGGGATVTAYTASWL